MKTIKIGVLGGIGPEATGNFYLKIIRKLQETGLIKSNEDFPQIIINSIPAPELIYGSISEKDLEPYFQGLKELDAMNPDFIVMVCNTIHLFYDQLQEKTKSKIIDLRKEVFTFLKEKNINKISILGTPSSIESGLYNFRSIGCYNPTKKELEILGQAIFNFNKGTNKEEQIKKTDAIANRLLSEGSEMILLACTELAVMLEDSPIPHGNTIDILAETVIEKYKKLC